MLTRFTRHVALTSKLTRSVWFAPKSASTEHHALFTAPRESLEFDFVIVGGGVAGLSTAIRLKQIAQERSEEVSVCVLEKGAEIGSHIISGNVFDPRALTELFPDWKEKGAPLRTRVKKDRFRYLHNEKTAIPLPIPSMLSNDDNYIISLGELTRWLSGQAEDMGVEVYSGFAVNEVLFSNGMSSVEMHDGMNLPPDVGVVGVATADVGIDKKGFPKSTFQRGMELRAKHTVLCEGARGYLSERIISYFKLRKNSDPQTYALGFKEIWEVPESVHELGTVEHSVGWPLDRETYGGSFCYHAEDNKLFLGFAVGLDFANNFISPYKEFQKFKTHDSIRYRLAEGKCIQYGARVINEGGLQSIPELSFRGGSLAGCSAGFLNVPRIKGAHTAMKSGMLVAESAFAEKDKLGGDSWQCLENVQLDEYPRRVEDSWIFKELQQVRNVRPAFKHGLYPGLMYAGLSTLVLKGREPWTFAVDCEDHETTLEHESTSKSNNPVEYAPIDEQLVFDRLTNLSRSGVNHEEDQVCHLQSRKMGKHDRNGSARAGKSVFYYKGVECRICPAGVCNPSAFRTYAQVYDLNEARTELVVNAQNCIHCKACDIKPPYNHIVWTPPEGGGGPA